MIIVIASLMYLVLGFFQILFAWLGLLCFFIPLIIAIVKGNKGYCNRYCGRGQLFELIGGRFGLSRRKDVPKWMKSKAFRYGFLIFFFAYVFSNAVDDVSCVFRSRKSASGSYLVMDLEASVELGVSWRECFAGNRAVRIWILQCDADFYRTWICDDAVV